MAKYILIVDESASMREIVKGSARQAGIGNADFAEAGHGVGGMDAVEPRAFDLILCDVNLPFTPETNQGVSGSSRK